MKQLKDTSEEKENKQISISSSHKPSYRSPLTMQKQANNLPYVRGKSRSVKRCNDLDTLKNYWIKKHNTRNVCENKIQLIFSFHGMPVMNA